MAFSTVWQVFSHFCFLKPLLLLNSVCNALPIRMQYDKYLASGYPIGTGAVEGTCKNLVKERMEGSGMRWVVAGAEAVLRLRSVYQSHYWSDFWNYYTLSQKSEKRVA